MSETLNLDQTNFGLWGLYRKRCKTEKQTQSDYCQKLYALLFLKSKN